MYNTRRQYAAAVWALLEADQESRPHFNIYRIANYAGALFAYRRHALLGA